jgi:hypothetical protein
MPNAHSRPLRPKTGQIAMLSACPLSAESVRRRLLLSRLVEISQIRRRLILLRGHQVSFRAQEVILRADDHMMVILSTNRLAPDRMFFCVAKVLLGDGPRTRQRMIDHGDFVVQRVRIGVVEAENFPASPLNVHSRWVATKRDRRERSRRHTPANQLYPRSSQNPPGKRLVTKIAVIHFGFLNPSLVGMRSLSG